MSVNKVRKTASTNGFSRNFIKGYIEQIIPSDLQSNLEDVHTIDNLLYQLENTFTKSSIYAQGGSEVVCSAQILRVLLTLSIESIATDKDGVTSIDGVMNSTAFSLSSSLATEYSKEYNSSYKLPIHTRSLALLRKYLKVMVKSYGEGDLFVYHELKVLVMDFLALKTSKRVLRNKLKVNYDIFNHFRALGADLDNDPSFEIDDSWDQSQEAQPDTQEVADIISDSEDEIEVIDHPFMVNELRRFKLSSTNSGASSVANFQNDPVTATLFEDMPHLESKSPTPGPHGASKRGHTNKQENRSQPKLKIFGEDLLTWKLSPANPDNESYDIWKLISWCFNCNKFLVYKNYSLIIDWLVDFIGIDFNIHVGKITSEASKASNLELTTTQRRKLRSALSQECQVIKEGQVDAAGVLLTNFLSHLSAHRRDWFDRLVECTMSGLTYKNKAQPCYKREKAWKLATEARSNLESIDIVVDSLTLRFKILLLAYQWEYYQQEDENEEESEGEVKAKKGAADKIRRVKEIGEEIDADDNSRLVIALSERLHSLPYTLLREFYLCSYDQTTSPYSAPREFSKKLLFESTVLLLNKHAIKFDLQAVFSSSPKRYSGVMKNLLNTFMNKAELEDASANYMEYESVVEYRDQRNKFLFLASWLFQACMENLGDKMGRYVQQQYLDKAEETTKYVFDTLSDEITNSDLAQRAPVSSKYFDNSVAIHQENTFFKKIVERVLSAQERAALRLDF